MKETLDNKISVQPESSYDVIISGAGPVGLFLACELALAQCTVLILEKAASAHSPLKQMPFGIRGLSAPSVEALYRRGLLHQLEWHKRMKDPHMRVTQSQGQQAPRQVGHFAGIPLLEDHIDTTQWEYRLPGSPDTHLLSEMEEIETVLTRRAEALGVSIQRGLAITHFQQSETAVTVQAGDVFFTAKWLVGCDGSRSVVRKVGGFEFAGTEPEFTGYSVKADMADADKLSFGRHFTAKGMYLKSQPGFLGIQEFDGGAFHNAGTPVTLEHVQEVLRRVSDTDVTITALHMATTWTDRARQATAYRNGRVLLAGDAAHIHSPLGGQGLNLGLGDAMNLGWKLAATIHGKAPEGLLDSYHAERYPIGAQVLDWSRAQVAIMNPLPKTLALNAVIRDLINTRDGATYIAGRLWGVHTRYPFGDSHPLEGRSVPNFEWEDGVTVGERMRDGKALLLDFNNNALLKTWAGAYSHSIGYVGGDVKDALGVHALLVRPDGIVAWACNSQPDMDALQLAADRWFCK
ncbi:2-polyprenyl-6-methoxyphenol hydroxylase [Filimonas lacunae]|uniref:2-polyprenyl-6-methoxyphenol hydroxylase n=1 Tax=Filimonas lacunae TaxID=477680 RepID=A0A173M964_9BACT|nr:FAD-dependent monooxygenase [Filimonas lacunae]BAV04060.1 salicylate hydroxylase [Filimonas lacunae]SIT15858.1 2-polyprenyl-6-methoxyphenol hydroxylase [Filimonas lacunae]